ncbi:Stk1 family PASTA domain-containing Ser/Thr kinase [Kitasatospora sp. NA04385]|uniref:Stk1 family PASTA domain-containing Ser/Thr kinase n=1 Tax=Kitasatospora sp. NA04385 TaxID=2742135 RepID=UPI001590E8A3|nr:Stk1 family PASTA domain-containing Ser/Thr kinase [Kitasatospora sp. NA04385]QKW20789.1 Stk1 family PASTA domain-containing Ser/Thr kinase [Kitasatospora sp. NA04385]
MEEPRRLGGRYELGGVLGRGGMAEVYLGHDTRLGRTVAVKTLRTDMARDPSFQARFRREAQSAASLNHPAIVAVYDTGEDYIDGISIPYIVMEYVEGSTLRELLHTGRRLLPERALEMTIGILQALEYSHRAGIVHRDIKPANVMLTRQGNVKVMDFGIARAMGDAGMTMTQTSAVIGTAQYLSPEQAKGETVDARSDLYSTGCLLYELLTVRPPFVGDSPVAVAYQHVREEAAPPSSYDPEVRPEIDAIVLKALAKERDYRYQSADEMRDDIERFLDGLPVNAAQQAAYGMGAAGYGYDQGGNQYDPYGQTNVLPQQGGGPTTMLPPVGNQQQPAPYGGYQDNGYGGGGDGYEGRSSRRRDEQPKKSNTSWIVLAVAAVLVLVGAFFVVQSIVKTGGSNAGKSTVPNLVGLTLAEAESAAKAQSANLKVTAGDPAASCADTKIQKDQVCTQSPAAAGQMASDGTITVHLTAAPAQVDVPDVTGQAKDAATKALKDKGFDVKVTYANDDKVDQDKVVSQDVKDKAAPGATVTLTVSSGQQKTAVPNVTGKALDEATRILDEAGFNVVTAPKTVTDPTQAGQILDQTPKGAQQAKQGSTVTLTVGKQADKVSTPITENRTYKQVIADLQKNHLQSVVVNGGPQDENAIVIKSDPPANTLVDQGTTIQLWTRPGDKPATP